MRKILIAVFMISTVLTGCGTSPEKKPQSLDSVSTERVFPDLKTAILKNQNFPNIPIVNFREVQYTFDWRDTLISTPLGRIPAKKIEFDLASIKLKSKPKMNDRFKLPEIVNPKFLTICSYFSQADRDSVSAIIPEVFWLDSQNQLTKLETAYFNRSSTSGMRGCLVSTIPLPDDFEKSPQIVIHPKRFDSFVKPIASFQLESMVMAGPVFVPIKGVITVLPDVIGDIKIEISDLPKYGEGSKSVEDIN